MDDTRPVLDDALRARWADALESGKYPQGHNVLRGSTGYCCLGVLGEICEVWPEHGDGEDPTYLTSDGEQHDYTPQARALDRHSLVRNLSLGQQAYFARLNDVERRDFAYIAKAVRTKLDLDPLRGEDRR